VAGSELPIGEFRKNLRVLEREVQLSMASDTGCCGVTLAQCHLLLEVDLRGSTSATKLAEILELDKSTLSRAVDGMCRSGLLSRETDSSNRRRQIIRLTKKGRTRADAINGICNATYTRLLDCVPAGKRKIVVESVALLASAMRRMRRETDPACCAEKAGGGKET
jgi:DNA-binding MarR family transcriptional regulator